MRLSRHITAVVDGVIHDTHDPSRKGTRCVYGYWYQEQPAPAAKDLPRTWVTTLSGITTVYAGVGRSR